MGGFQAPASSPRFHFFIVYIKRSSPCIWVPVHSQTPHETPPIHESGFFCKHLHKALLSFRSLSGRLAIASLSLRALSAQVQLLNDYVQLSPQCAELFGLWGSQAEREDATLRSGWWGRTSVGCLDMGLEQADGKPKADEILGRWGLQRETKGRQVFVPQALGASGNHRHGQDSGDGSRIAALLVETLASVLEGRFEEGHGSCGGWGP